MGEKKHPKGEVTPPPNGEPSHEEIMEALKHAMVKWPQVEGLKKLNDLYERLRRDHE